MDSCLLYFILFCFIYFFLTNTIDLFRCVAFDSKTIVSGSWDNYIKVWDLNTGDLKKSLLGHESRVLCLAFDEKKIVCSILLHFLGISLISSFSLFLTFSISPFPCLSLPGEWVSG